MSGPRRAFDPETALAGFSDAIEAWRVSRLDDEAPQVGRAAEEMPEMAAQLGVDVAELEATSPGIVKAMEINCAGCAAKDTCRTALKEKTAAKSFGGFCANARTFEAYLLDHEASA